MRRFITAPLAALCLCFFSITSFADGIWVGRGPISCQIPVDSISTQECDDSVVITGHSGRCKMSATKDGVEYSVDVRVSGHSVPRLPLAPITAAIPRLKGKAQRCMISGEVTMSKCTTWDTGYRSGGTCSVCTTKECYQGTAQITLTPKKPLRRVDR